MVSTARAAGTVAAAIACLFLAGCGGGGDGSERDAARPAGFGLFAYDRSQPLDDRDRGAVTTSGPIKVHAVSYRSPRGGRVNGFLLLPPGKGPFPAVVFMHGAGGNRLSLLSLASWLAGRRAVALTIDSPFSRGPLEIRTGIAGVRKDRDLNVQNVIDLRRADLLERRPEVDEARIGYVGYSAGARTGAILAGVDSRITAFVLMSGGATPPSAYADAAPPELRGEVLRILSSADPLRFIRHAAPASLLFLNGRRDEVVPRAALVALHRAASMPKEVRWYAAAHALSARAYREGLDWLTRKLPIAGPPVPGALTGPPAGTG